MLTNMFLLCINLMLSNINFVLGSCRSCQYGSLDLEVGCYVLVCGSRDEDPRKAFVAKIVELYDNGWLAV